MKSLRLEALLLALSLVVTGGCGEESPLPSSEPEGPPAQAAHRLLEPARLLKDVGRSSIAHEDQNAAPGQYTRVGALTFFVATTTQTGAELWRTDGTEAGTVLVKDIYPGVAGSSIYKPTAVGDTLFFVAANPATGYELWKSDGTEAGTVLVRDSIPGTAASSITTMAAVGTTLFFSLDEKGLGSELWKSDGTAAGTVLVRDIYPGASGSSPQGMTSMGGVLYFTANSAEGRELWRSDGTAAGTVRIKDIYVGTGSGDPLGLTVVGGALYFKATNGTNGYELWRSDGTATGTVMVKDLNPGSSSSSPRTFVEMDGIIYFAAFDPAAGTELWRTDGTEAGTFLVKDIYPGTTTSNLDDLTVVGSTLFFSADEPSVGRELWRSDGTSAGTLLVKDIRVGTTGTQPGELTAFNGRLYFRELYGPLYMSDGTAAGTVVVSSASGYQTQMIVAGNLLIFTADTYTSGTEPWKSDGTAAGTRMLKEVQPNHPSSRPGFFTPVGGKVFFRAKTATDYYGVYQTDGTEAGTSAVGSTGQYQHWESRPLTAVNGMVFGVGYQSSPGTELWKTDGTAASTVLVKDIYPGGTSDPTELTAMGNAVYFRATEPTGGSELWKSDGTTAGTVRVKDIYVGAGGAYPAGMVLMNGLLYFRASDSTGGSELWKSDGTEAGTVRIKDIVTGTAGSSPSNLTVVGNTLYFVATVSTLGAELWKSDGTEAGTVLVRDIVTGTTGSNPQLLTAAGDTLYFQAVDAAGSELWKSDGTAAGTVRVKDIFPGAANSSPRNLTAVNQRLYFGAASPNEGYELWTSDGTEAGTVLVRDLVPGTGSGLANEPMLGLGPEGLLLFTATDGSSGMEPWVSDGTTAGTQQLMDVAPGARSSAPGSYTRVGPLLYFAAENGVNGREPWVFSLASFRDITPPTVTCPGMVTVEATGSTGASASYPPATVSDDNLSVTPVVTYSHPSGSLFPLGLNPVTVTATDGAGNSASCTFLVRVLDTTAPAISCPGNALAQANGPAGAMVHYPPATASDSTSFPVISYSLPPGSLFPLGSTTVTATATDDAGLRASCSFEVTVQDDTAPLLVCPDSVVVAATGPGGATVSYRPAAATDDVTPVPAVAYSHVSGSTFPLGTTAVSVTAVDTTGNRSICSFTITVLDLAPPTLSCPGPVAVQATSAAGAVVRYPPATASDAMSHVNLAYSRLSGTSFPPGTTPVTVTATDSAGNTATCTFAVSVQDTLPPTLGCPASITTEATDASGAQVTYPAATVSDATGSVTVAYSHPAGSVFPLGVNLVTVTAMDGSGNSGSCAFSITVRDTRAPMLTCPFNVTAEATDLRGTQVTYPAAIVSDTVSALPTVVYSKDSGSAFLPGQTRVTVMATDESGNAATCNFFVTVRDTRAPSITCPAPVQAEATDSTGAPVHYEAASATDVLTLSPAVTYSHAAGSTFPLGTTQVTATATDAAGNRAACTFPVTVRDTQGPSLSCPPNLFVQATSPSGAVGLYPAATASDGISSASVAYSHPSGALFPLGTTMVIATATDSSGNRSTCAFNVVVHDATAPALTCPAHVVAEATEPGGTVVTYPDGVVSDILGVTQSASPASGSLFPVGLTAVTVAATDGMGNSSHCVFTVHVRDTTAPTLSCPGNLAVQATSLQGASVEYPPATASDAVTPTPEVTYSHVSGMLFPVGTTTLNAVARDAAGNSATCTFNVVVQPPFNG